MQKFPVGSKVRIIAPSSMYQGKVCTVVKYDEKCVYPYCLSVSPFQTCTFKEKELEQVIGAVDEATEPVAITNSNGGIKFDGGKIDYTYLLKDLPVSVEEVTKVLIYGAKKYSRSNYSKVESERYEAACLRHLMAYLQGEQKDPETGYHHLAHAVCCLMFLVEREVKNES